MNFPLKFDVFRVSCLWFLLLIGQSGLIKVWYLAKWEKNVGLNWIWFSKCYWQLSAFWYHIIICWLQCCNLFTVSFDSLELVRFSWRFLVFLVGYFCSISLSLFKAKLLFFFFFGKPVLIFIYIYVCMHFKVLLNFAFVFLVMKELGIRPWYFLISDDFLFLD